MPSQSTFMASPDLRIILIDDNPGDRLLALRELTQEFPNLQAEQITDQAAFEGALATQRFDVVITDYQLHWGDGLQVLRRVKRRFPDCPVIMFTNSSNGELAAQAMKDGLDDYVTKSPRQYIRLAGAVRSALAFTRANRRVERLQSRLQTLLNRLHVGVFRASVGGRLIECNIAFLQLLGFTSSGQIQQLPFEQLYCPPPDGAPEGYWENEILLQRPDGSELWVLLSATLSAGEDGGIIDGLIEDISARKQNSEQLERRVRERTVQLEAANQELEAFTYSVSHDLREPLRNMQGLAQALLEDFSAQLPPTAHQYAQLIVRSSQQMDTLIQDLLTYSRLGRADTHPQPVNLNTVISAVLTQLQTKLQEVGAEVQVASPLPEVHGHFNTLVQVLLNLLTNAIKFVAPGVTPRVRIRADVHDREGSRWVRLWVEDNGIGVSPENHQRIFRVFERLHGSETYPGTGIGLAIVRKGIEQHGGRAGVEADLGQGSRFWVDLPPVADG
ncbi:two-component hybrid sensor and regulator [Gloeobacter violaceus PCC 7421]|uniref:histidine kinase n=2 Tax=Gloeobacter violaceus TaxID=33072 RepID=Q7NKE5_GLOVI|nr:two-component hybrid sensor and regulator [Gloeobacter violaceus PCC 7421]